jgi:hypothetical protein
MAATDLNLVAIGGLLRRLYPYKTVINSAARENPFFTMVRKNTEGGGEAIVVPFQTGSGASNSADFATAQAGQAPSANKFLLTGTTIHSVVTIQRDAIRAAKNSAAALQDAVKFAADRKLTTLVNDLGSLCFGAGTGLIASAVSVTSGVATFSDPMLVSKFQIGQKLFAATSDGGALAGAPDPAYVIKKDVGAGTVTVSTTLGGAAGQPGSWTGSYTFLHGAGNTGGAVFKGMAAWVPTTAPTGGDSFGGLDRSTIGSDAYGLAINVAGKPMKEALVYGATLLTANGGSPTHVFANPMDVGNLVNTLADLAMYEAIETPTATVGLQAVRVVVPTGNGKILVVADRSVPIAQPYMIRLEDWEFVSVGDAPGPADPLNGDVINVRDTADSVDARYCAGLAALICKNPAWQGVLKNFGQ